MFLFCLLGYGCLHEYNKCPRFHIFLCLLDILLNDFRYNFVAFLCVCGFFSGEGVIIVYAIVLLVIFVLAITTKFPIGNLHLKMMESWEALKLHQNFSTPSSCWVIDQNMQNIYLINNSTTAWPSKIWSIFDLGAVPA